jgi:hypothetical protein
MTAHNEHLENIRHEVKKLIKKYPKTKNYSANNMLSAALAEIMIGTNKAESAISLINYH